MKNNKTERVLTSLLMGVNCVNGFAPLAAALPIADVSKPVTKTKAADEQIEYTPVNYQSLVDSVDRAVFGTAEAAFTENVGTAYASSAVSGETITKSGATSVQTVYAGGTTSNGYINSGGTQNVSSGGTGHLLIMRGNTDALPGWQNVYGGGTGLVGSVINRYVTQGVHSGGYGSMALMHNGGNQIAYTGGVAEMAVMEGGSQVVAGGIATVDLMADGDIGAQSSYQIVSGGTGTVVIMSGIYATQRVSGGTGIIENLSRGNQRVYSGAIGSIVSMVEIPGPIGENGQYISSGGSGYIYDMQEGIQQVNTGASATIHHLSGMFARQDVFSGASGHVDNLDFRFASQSIRAGATGTIDDLQHGSQVVRAGASGSITRMSGSSGYQIISSGGTARVDSMGSGAWQYVYTQGTAVVDLMNSGVQRIEDGGTGSVNTMKKGEQVVYSTGSAVVYDMSSGIQTMYASASGSVNTMSGGTQNIYTDATGSVTDMQGSASQNIRFGTGTIVNMSGGSQTVLGSGGSGIIQTLSNGVQAVQTGGVGVVQVMSGGTQHVGVPWANVSGGTGIITDMKSGTQIISIGGLALSTNVNGGNQELLAGAAVSNNVVAGSGVQNVLGTPQSLVNNVVRGGGVQNVSTGAVVTNQSIGVGGTQNILLGGSAEINTTVNIDGVQNVVGEVTVTTGGNQVVNGLVSVAPGGALAVNGTQTINAGGVANGTEVSSGGQQVVNGGTAVATTLQEGAVQTIRAGLIAGQEVASGVTQQLMGGTVDGDKITGGTVELYNHGAAFQDVRMDDGLIRFGADGGNYNILGTFDFRGGLVDMTQNPDGHLPNPGTWETLTINNLTGNDGIFKMDTDLDSAVIGKSVITNGDKIVIENGDPNAQHYIQVVDRSLYTGTEISGGRKLLLVTDDSSQNFTIMGKELNNGGLWLTHAPELIHEGNKWYLGYIEKEPTNDTTIFLNDRQTVYNQWARINNDSLRKRLGDLRYNDAESGVWARMYKGRLEGQTFSQDYTVYQLGIDKTSGRWTYGLAVDKQDTKQQYGFGTGDGSTKDINIYATQYSDTGSYLDLIGKYGKVNSKYSTYGDNPDHADYDTTVWSFSAEYGKTNKYKNGYFLEPKIQLTYGDIGSSTYYTDRQTMIEEDAIKSLIGRVGFVAGRKIKDTDFYFKASWLKEFKGDRYVHLNAANGENMYASESYGDSWFELGVGGNVKIAKKTHLYGDIEKSFGAAIQKKWQINAGVRWEF